MYALDTNTLIYFFKGMGRIAERLGEVPPEEVAVPTVVLFELSVGIAKSQNPDKRIGLLTAFIERALVLPFDGEAAYQAAQVRVALEKQGQPIGPMDVLIAGTALAHQATLVTHNIREFSRVSGLVVKDWY